MFNSGSKTDDAGPVSDGILIVDSSVELHQLQRFLAPCAGKAPNIFIPGIIPFGEVQMTEPMGIDAKLMLQLRRLARIIQWLPKIVLDEFPNGYL